MTRSTDLTPLLKRLQLEVWPESPLSGFALRERDVFQSYPA